MNLADKTYFSTHVVEKYRARVVEDDIRRSREYYQIIGILKDALRFAVVPKNIGKQTRIAIRFNLEEKLTSLYYLVISPRVDNEDYRAEQKPYVAKTLLYSDKTSRAVLSKLKILNKSYFRLKKRNIYKKRKKF